MAFLETVSSLSYKDCLQWLERKLPVVHPAMLTALSVCLNATQESKFMPQKSQFNWESGRNLTLAQVASIVGVVLFSENKVEENVFEKHLLLKPCQWPRVVCTIPCVLLILSATRGITLCAHLF